MRSQLVLALILCFSALFIATDACSAESRPTAAWPSPNWDRDLALLAASQAATRQEADRLFEIASQGHGATTLQAIVKSAFGTGLSEPAREAVLLRFTNQLRGLPPFSIDTAVLDFLLNYQNQTLVAHEESIGMAVPLFPIRAAAHGLVFQWTRQQAALDSAALMTGQPKQIVDVYAANTDRNIRSGIEAAIGQADPETLQSMLDYGMPLLSVNPGLTALLGKSAMELGDVQAVSEVFIQGGGHELVEISRLAGQRFSNPDLGHILLMTVDAAPASTAALLIAEMAPYSIVQQEVSEALLQKLGDAELGSAAALALGRWGSAQQREALAATVAKDPSSLAAKRAQRALSVNVPVSGGGLRR
jgi:hypothetical protein